jgi:hypothetical protein
MARRLAIVDIFMVLDRMFIESASDGNVSYRERICWNTLR